uniref:propionate--CoA ligase n=1 Tax=Photorhabdus sp. RM322S TaxID=3342825 RepID=UPI0036D8B4AB
MLFKTFYQQSIDDPHSFWADQAKRIFWQQPFEQVLDHNNPPFARWFCGGKTNLCYNALDRWLESQPDAKALIMISTETNSEKVFTFRELHREVNRTAAMMLSLGVKKGDRVLVYMPMIAEALFVLLACARIGAVHSVVFGGFAAQSLATRLDNAEPVLVVSADAGSRGGKVIPYKSLLDEAIELANHKPRHVLMVNRRMADMVWLPERDVDFATLRQEYLDSDVPVTWLESNETSCVLYTSGTTGTPKGVQRDVGGYAVALATSMDIIFGGKAGEVFFCTSDIGWVVGHSYIAYAPLIAGMATIMYEGLPIRPDAGIWWQIVEKYQVTRMFSAPTAMRVLKKYPVESIAQYDISSLKSLYLAGEPLDEHTARWIAEAINTPVIDNYWQTETGWPIMAIARALDDRQSRFGSTGFPMYGFHVKLINELTGEECGDNEKGLLVVEGPLPPGCIQTIYGDDTRFINTYWRHFDQPVYSTFDWGIRDSDGYYFILGRSDDVINVAGHRLGTREIEECIAGHEDVAEVAVIGIKDAIKGQAVVAFAVLKDGREIQNAEHFSSLEKALMGLVNKQIGSVGRSARVYFVSQLPKTRSGKMLRRTMQAICEGREPGDISLIENPASLEVIWEAVFR